jgi:ribonuclease BN (tRNA processing enzyme)
MRTLTSVLLTLLVGMSAIALAGESAAQTPGAAAPSKPGSRLITLGTRSGPLPTVGRAQSSNVLIVNGAAYLVDAGEGVTRRLVRAGIAIRDLDTMFITHPHSDHTGGLGGLLAAEYDYNRTKPVTIYGPPGTQATVNGLVQYLTVSSEIRISDGTRTVPVAKVFFGRDVGTGVIFQDANVKVTAVENSHFNFPPGTPAYGKYKSYSYRFDTADRAVVFSGDTGASAALTELAKGADLLVTEVNSVEEAKALRIKNGLWQRMSTSEQESYVRHMIDEHLTPEQIGAMAAQAGVKTVLLTHLPNSADPKDDYKRYSDGVSKSFSGKVLVAKDLMEF